MTSKEIVDLIKVKKASAETEFKSQKKHSERLCILGKLEAYQDLLIAIEQQEAKEVIANE